MNSLCILELCWEQKKSQIQILNKETKTKHNLYAQRAVNIFLTLKTDS